MIDFGSQPGGKTLTRDSESTPPEERFGHQVRDQATPAGFRGQTATDLVSHGGQLAHLAEVAGIKGAGIAAAFDQDRDSADRLGLRWIELLADHRSDHPRRAGRPGAAIVDDGIPQLSPDVLHQLFWGAAGLPSPAPRTT